MEGNSGGSSPGSSGNGGGNGGPGGNPGPEGNPNPNVQFVHETPKDYAEDYVPHSTTLQPIPVEKLGHLQNLWDLREGVYTTVEASEGKSFSFPIDAADSHVANTAEIAETMAEGGDEDGAGNALVESGLKTMEQNSSSLRDRFKSAIDNCTDINDADKDTIKSNIDKNLSMSEDNVRQNVHSVASEIAKVQNPDYSGFYDNDGVFRNTEGLPEVSPHYSSSEESSAESSSEKEESEKGESENNG